MTLIPHKEAVAFNIWNSTINKGEIENSFGYAHDDVRFPKKGLEIKDKLETVIIGKGNIVNGIKSILQDLCSVLPTMPTQDLDEYCFGQYKNKIYELMGDLVKVYNYDLTCWRSDMTDNMNMSESPNQLVNRNNFASDEQTASMYRKYNELVRQCVDTYCELCLASIICNNLNDNTVYQLNVKQLQSLGF